MSFSYDPEADAGYFTLSSAKIAVTREIDEHTIVDFDERGGVVGIELLSIRERKPDLLAALSTVSEK